MAVRIDGANEGQHEGLARRRCWRCGSGRLPAVQCQPDDFLPYALRRVVAGDHAPANEECRYRARLLPQCGCDLQKAYLVGSALADFGRMHLEPGVVFAERTDERQCLLAVGAARGPEEIQVNMGVITMFAGPLDRFTGTSSNGHQQQKRGKKGAKCHVFSFGISYRMFSESSSLKLKIVESCRFAK